jgi:hypothetical protein
LSRLWILCCVNFFTIKKIGEARHQWLTVVISTTQEAEIEKITILGQPGQKRSRDPISTEKAGQVIRTCHPSYSGKSEMGASWSRLAWAKSKIPISKITSAKRAGGIAQVVKCLPGKWETLSSNSSNTHTQNGETMDGAL